MDSETILTFLKLSEVRNFTKTANEMFVAQSTVTNRIAELEKELNKKLFIREKNNIALTEEGNLFLSYAKRIISLENEVKLQINSTNFYHNTIKVGTTNTIYQCHLYIFIKDIMQKHADTNIKVTISHSLNMLHRMQDGLLDVVFSYIPLKKSGYICNLFAVDELILVTSSKNTEYKSGISKHDLVNINYLFCNFALQDVGIFIRELFPKFYQFSFEIDNSITLIKYLIDNIGYSFLPKSLVMTYINNGDLIRIPLMDFETPKLNNYICCKKDNKDLLVLFSKKTLK